MPGGGRVGHSSQTTASHFDGWQGNHKGCPYEHPSNPLTFHEGGIVGAPPQSLKSFKNPVHPSSKNPL